MKTLRYADYAITTTDATADAVLGYAKALALENASDTVHVVGLDDGGRQQGFDLLLGPASQIVAADAHPGDDGVDDRDVVADLTSRAERLTTPDVVVADADASTAHLGQGDELDD